MKSASPKKTKPKENNERNEEFYQRQQFFLAPDMISFLRQESHKLNRSRGSIVRAAIRLYAKQYQVLLAPERIGDSHRRRYSSP